jgi:hypothetical protein
MKGDACLTGTCKAICGLSGAAPTCGTNFTCDRYAGIFNDSNGVPFAGACDPTCDPLNDNLFGKASKTGTACTSGNGCYGFPDPTNGTRYVCAREINTTLFHRSACTAANGCASGAGNPFLNGCAQGFVPLFLDRSGSTQIDCVSFCKPANCYNGNCGAGNANQTGDSTASPRHQCNTTDSSGTFDPTTVNCIHEWVYDVGQNGLVSSPTEDTVGWCQDNKFYFYDSSGGANQCTAVGVPAATCAQIPNCSSLPLMVATDNGLNTAGDWGCVDHTIGKNGGLVPRGVAPAPPKFLIDLPRPAHLRFN